MITKNKKTNRKFTPVSISDSLKEINQKFLYKFGKLDYTINAKWGNIVGNFFINHTEPLKITSIPRSKDDQGDIIYDKFLHVSVSPAAALDFQHFQDKIVEKINSYLGYKAIKGIKIHQNKLKNDVMEKSNKNVNLIKNNKNMLEIKKSAPNLSNKDLEDSIVKLGLSITNDEK